MMNVPCHGSSGYIVRKAHIASITGASYQRFASTSTTRWGGREAEMDSMLPSNKGIEKKLRHMNRQRNPGGRDQVHINVPQTIVSILQQGDDYPFAKVRENLEKRKRIVIDYSSPNIAKPFHAGHWRSTVLGNFIANLNERCGHDVERINFLGDWGTQFGILAAGFERFGSEDELSSKKLDHLLDVYARANAESDVDESFKAKCAECQARLEAGTDDKLRDLWHRFRVLSMDYYTTMYNLLGISPFSHTQCESSYAESARTLVHEILPSSLLPSEDSHNQSVSYSVAVEGTTNPVRLLKSDGSSLYLSRDLAALKHRAEQFNFDTIYYVVDNAQTDHFHNLFRIAQQYVPVLRGRDMQHIKFGRVRGMSSRKGDGVKLADLIREAETIAADRIAKSRFSRSENPEEAAHYCALAAMLVNDLRERRRSDYEYSPDRFLAFEGDTGMTLQYLHSRLCSLERTLKENRDIVPSESAVFGTIVSLDGALLVKRLAESQDAVRCAYEELEPHYIVQYLFRLRHAANKALASLRVIGEREDIAAAHLGMYAATRKVLNVLLKTIGVKPLERM